MGNTPSLTMNPRPTRSPDGSGANAVRVHTIVAAKDYIFTAYGKSERAGIAPLPGTMIDDVHFWQHKTACRSSVHNVRS